MKYQVRREDFSRSIKDRLESTGESQRALAQQAGVYQPMVSRLVNCEQAELTAAQATTFAALLSVEVDDLIRREDTPDTPPEQRRSSIASHSPRPRRPSQDVRESQNKLVRRAARALANGDLVIDGAWKSGKATAVRQLMDSCADEDEPWIFIDLATRNAERTMVAELMLSTFHILRDLDVDSAFGPAIAAKLRKASDEPGDLVVQALARDIGSRWVETLELVARGILLQEKRVVVVLNGLWRFLEEIRVRESQGGAREKRIRGFARSLAAISRARSGNRKGLHLVLVSRAGTRSWLSKLGTPGTLDDFEWVRVKPLPEPRLRGLLGTLIQECEIQASTQQLEHLAQTLSPGTAAEINAVVEALHERVVLDGEPLTEATIHSAVDDAVEDFGCRANRSVEAQLLRAFWSGQPRQAAYAVLDAIAVDGSGITRDEAERVRSTFPKSHEIAAMIRILKDLAIVDRQADRLRFSTELQRRAWHARD